MKSALSRWILIAHRYLGVVVGLLMTIWCLSGFVMMYQGFPSFTETERVQALPPLDLSGPLALDAVPLADDAPMQGFRLEMLGDRPLLRGGGGRRGGGDILDLRTGTALGALSDAEVRGIVDSYVAGNGIVAGPGLELRQMDTADQWTIQTFRRAQPVYHVVLDDAAGTHIYVSGKSGEIIQDTNRQERFLSWLGAIPHWLYPTILRANCPLWTQVVIWSSVIGVFLAATGLYVGIGRLGRRKNGRWSPYRGLWFWHHMIGLTFGVLTLTWVFSGLMTMNPWGLLEGGRSDLRGEVAGKTQWSEARAAIDLLRREHAAHQIRSTILGGKLHLVAIAPEAEQLRLDAAGQPSPLEKAEVVAAMAGLPVAGIRFTPGDDAYHYRARGAGEQPAWRVDLADADRTRIYIDARTGDISRVVDANARLSRWLRNGLHSLDFIRGRPLWDIVTLLLLAGVTAVCGTGTWMSFRRISRDARMAIRAARKGRRRAATAAACVRQ